MAPLRPAARSSGSVGALTLLVALLLCLQLILRPMPSEAKGGSVSARGRGPSQELIKLGILLAKKLAKVGKKVLIKKKYGNGDNDRLGGVAADNAGYVVYDVSVGNGTTATTFSGIVDITSEFVWGQCPSPPAPAFSRIPGASQTCQSTLNSTAADCGTVNTTGSRADCEYVYAYVAGVNTTGYLSDKN